MKDLKDLQFKSISKAVPIKKEPITVSSLPAVRPHRHRRDDGGHRFGQPSDPEFYGINQVISGRIQ